VATGHTVLRASLVDGRKHSLELPHAASAAALSADGSRALATGDLGLSLAVEGGGPRTVELAAPAARVAIDGDLAATLMVEAGRLQLRAWWGDGLELAAGGVDLGQVAPDGMLVDGPRGRILTWGLRGPRARMGEGEPAAALVEIRGGDPRIAWSGEGGPLEAAGFVFPLAGGAVGAYSSTELAVLAPGEGGGWQRVRTLELAGLESAVASSDGSRIAWSFSEYDEASSRDLGHVGIARLDDGAVEQTLAVPRSGTFSALAVDDGGMVTFATTGRPDGLVVFAASEGVLVPRLEIELPTT
jgi:hypothetical protein